MSFKPPNLRTFQVTHQFISAVNKCNLDGNNDLIDKTDQCCRYVVEYPDPNPDPSAWALVEQKGAKLDRKAYDALKGASAVTNKKGPQYGAFDASTGRF